jgi:3-dehydroquinate dehydratase-2
LGLKLGLEVSCAQSNHEGELIDLIEQARGKSAALLINPGGLTHTSVALLDALRGFDGYVVEVHLSNIYAREEFRRSSVTAEGADAVVCGFGVEGYRLALEAISKHLEVKQ